MRLSAVFLASGRGRRFGANKLLTPLHGRPLYQYGFLQLEEGLRLASVAGITSQLVVVSPYAELRAWCAARGAIAVTNGAASEGIAASVRIGTAVASAAEAIAFFVADRPLLEAGTIASFLIGYDHSGLPAGAMETAGSLGNPAVFHHTFQSELMRLCGDRGAGQLLHRLGNDCWHFPVDSWQLQDIDTQADFERLSQQMTAASRGKHVYNG